MVQQGRISVYIKTVSQVTPIPSSLDAAVDEDGKDVTTPETVHKVYTRYFTKVYSVPGRHAEGIHSDDWPWQTGGDKDEFLRRGEHYSIPSHLLDIIWEAIKRNPKASVISSQLEVIFSSSPSY